MLAGVTSRRPVTIPELLPPELAARLDGLDVLSRRVLLGKLQGERRSKRRGRSVEFDDYRDYVPGDDLRHIDWHVFARLDRFVVKVFQEEQDLAVHLVLDCSPSMNAGQPDKLLFAARLALALGYVALVRNNRVLVTAFGGPAQGGGLARLEPQRGRRNVQRLGQFVIDQALGPAPSEGPRQARQKPPADAFAEAMRGVALGPGGKGVVVLLSDLLIPPVGAFEPGLKLLASAAARTSGGGMDVYVLQTLAPGELDPAREGETPPAGTAPGQPANAARPAPLLGDLRLNDVETGRSAEVTITPELLEKYRASVKAYIENIARWCAARALNHALVTSDTDVPTLVLDVLRRRGLLR
jgi:hypothetical protein